jgi:hypothetical protein
MVASLFLLGQFGIFLSIQITFLSYIYDMNLSKRKYISPLLRIVTSPITVALVFTLVLLPFLRPYFPAYQAKITVSGIVERAEGLITYYDINCDGRSEQFISFINFQGKPTYKVTDQDGLVIDQQEFEGDAFPINCPVLFTDVNKNGNPETISFIQRNDSLFLYIIEYGVDLEKKKLAEVFIADVRNKAGKPNYNVYPGPFKDLDHDSTDEVIFSVMAGYPILPRSIFVYNLRKRELIHSGFIGSPGQVNDVFDLDQSGTKGLLVDQYAPGNLEDSLIEGVDDNSVRFMILDSRLKPVFQPVVFKGEYSSISCRLFLVKGKKLIAVIYNHKGKPKNPPLLQLFDLHGLRLASRTLFKGPELKVFNFSNNGRMNEIIDIKDEGGEIVSLDENLKIIGNRQTPLSHYSNENYFDLDNDGKPERIFLSGNLQRIAICRDDLSPTVYVDLPHEAMFSCMSIKKNTNKPNELFVQFHQKFFLVAYSRNPLYNYRYLASLGLFLVLAGFTFFVQYLQRVRTREKFRNERNLAALQFKLIKKQVDPHFLFNVITTLSYNLLSKDPEDAYTGISRLAKFMRSAVEWGDKIARPMKEELDVTQTYLELYRNQHPGKFEFSIEVDDAVDQNQPVPVMILQTFVENSIKHGINGRDGKGKVTIRIVSEARANIIEIEDNGIGRKASKESGATGTGKGLGLMNQYLDLLNKFNDKKVAFTITDLNDEQKELAGTLVKIVLPLDIKYYTNE